MGVIWTSNFACGFQNPKGWIHKKEWTYFSRKKKYHEGIFSFSQELLNVVEMSRREKSEIIGSILPHPTFRTSSTLTQWLIYMHCLANEASNLFFCSVGENGLKHFLPVNCDVVAIIPKHRCVCCNKYFFKIWLQFQCFQLSTYFYPFVLMYQSKLNTMNFKTHQNKWAAIIIDGIKLSSTRSILKSHTTKTCTTFDNYMM